MEKDVFGNIYKPVVDNLGLLSNIQRQMLNVSPSDLDALLIHEIMIKDYFKIFSGLSSCLLEGKC